MHAASHLNDGLIFLVAAVVVVSIMRMIRASSILGYLLAGVIIGPYALGFIGNLEGVKDLGEIGVVFLMFAIGLKMPLQRLRILKRYVFGLGLAQVAFTATIIAGIVWAFGLSTTAAVIIGSGLTLSSTAVVLQLLGETGETTTRFGRVSFSVLLLQDLAVVVLLVLLYSLDSQEGSVGIVIGLSALKASAVLVGITLIGRILLKPFFRLIASFDNQELFVATSLLVVLATSVLTANAGLSMELGAFLAGILLSETEYRHQVEADIHPFYGLLMGLFFISVGMGIDLRILVDSFFTIIGIISGMLLLKGVIIFGLCRAFRIPVGSSIRVTFLLSTGGEFVFVLFAPAITMGYIPESVGHLLYVVVAISMGLTPILAAVARKLEEQYITKQSDATLQMAEEEIGDLREHIILAGFGRVGKIVAHLLSKQLIPFVAIDNSMSRVSEGKAKGFPVYFGDARRAMVMRTLGISKAKGVVVCLNDPETSMRTTMMLRRHFPSTDVFVRLRDAEYETKLTQAGATVIMPENLEPSLQLAAAVMKSSGLPHDEVTQVIGEFRRNYSESSNAG